MSSMQTLDRETAPALAGRSSRAARVHRKGARNYWVYAGLVLVFIYCLAPFYWMVVSSLRRTADIFDNTPLPRPWSAENYQKVFDSSTMFGQSLLNSLIVAGITTAVALVIGIFAAYAIARLNFRYKSVILGVVIATSMFPGISVVVPLLRLFTNIGWINTYQAMIVPSLSFALPLAIWLLSSFFRALPFDLEEAAMIDGCSKWQAFRKILIPLAAPGVFTTAILTFIHAWNEFIIALSMVNDPHLQTATVTISKFTGATEYTAPFGEQMAAGVIVTVPLVIVVLIFQRRIVEGLTSGGVK